MRDWKMWHKNVGRESAGLEGLENTAQEIQNARKEHACIFYLLQFCAAFSSPAFSCFAFSAFPACAHWNILF